MGKETVNKRGLSWQSALSLATACERKQGQKKRIHSDLSAFGLSNEFQASCMELHASDKREEREERKAITQACKRASHYRSKFKRSGARVSALLSGKEVEFSYSVEFSTSKGVFKVEESEKTFESKAMAMQNCLARFRKFYRKRFRRDLPQSFKIKGRKAVSDNGIAIWELRIVETSTARDMAKRIGDKLESHKVPAIEPRRDTFKESILVRSK